MARGKNRNRAANRAQKSRDEQIAALQAELEIEQQLFAEAESECAKVDTILQEIEFGKKKLAQDTSPLLGRLLEQRNLLRTAYADARANYDTIHAAWNRYMDQCIDLSAGKTDLERLEAVTSILGTGAYIVDEVGGKQSKLSIEKATSLQRARGERTGASTSTPLSRALSSVDIVLSSGMLPLEAFLPLKGVGLWPEGADEPQLPDEASSLTSAQRKTIEQLARLTKRAENTTPGGVSKESVYIWGCSAIAPDDGAASPALEALGHLPANRPIVEPAAEAPPPGQYDWKYHSSQPADAFMKLKSSLFSNWKAASDALGTTATSLTPIPIHSRPGRGIAMQHAYVRSGLSSWMHCPANPNVYSQMTTRLAEASTYWLPAGQTAAFADSEPLDDEDRREMTLPFQQVLLAFAEPLILPAYGQRTPEDQVCFTASSEISYYTWKNDSDASSTLHRMAEAGELVKSLAGALEIADARIEGVLLLAGQDGSPEDQFAWCVAVPGEYGTTLGRYLIPASRSLTAYRDLIDNLTAVVAWAQWHEPDQESAVNESMTQKQLREKVKSTDFLNSATNSGVNIRVINVRGTSRRAGQKHVPTEARTGHESSKPHVRRGHWRRQRFGAGREQVKRIRISPVLVNAHRADIELRVYRLPAVKVA